MKFKSSNHCHLLKFESLVRESLLVRPWKRLIICHLFCNNATGIQCDCDGIGNSVKGNTNLEFKNHLLDEEAKRKESGKSTRNEMSRSTAFASTSDNRKSNISYTGNKLKFIDATDVD